MKTEQEWLDFEQKQYEWFKNSPWGPFKGYARNPDGTLEMFQDGPVPQSLKDLFAECDAHRAKLLEQGINPYDEL